MGCQVSKSQTKYVQKSEDFYETQKSLAHKSIKTSIMNNKPINGTQAKKNFKSLKQQKTKADTSLDEELMEYMKKIEKKRKQKQLQEKSIPRSRSPRSPQKETFVLSRDQCNKLKICRGSGISKSEYEYIVNKLDHQQQENSNQNNNSNQQTRAQSKRGSSKKSSFSFYQ